MKFKMYINTFIVVTSDLGRVTTSSLLISATSFYCGDVRSRTSYNCRFLLQYQVSYNCGDVRSRTSYNVNDQKIVTVLGLW